MPDAYEPTERTTVKRLPARGAYDKAVVHKILDEGMVCHLGFAVDGQPFVIPTLYVRIGETIYVHGSPASRMLQALDAGCESVCHGHARRWAGAGAIGVSPLDELPVGRGLRSSRGRVRP